jgi:hypothetical protein
MIETVSFSNDELLEIQSKYKDEEKGLKYLAYKIYDKFCAENNFTFREKINYFKEVRKKLGKK